MAVNHIEDDQLQELLDGNLAAERHEQARQHLADCPSCRERLTQYEAVYRGLRDDSEFVLPTGFAARVAAEAEAAEESSVWMSWPVLGGASLAAVVCTLVYMIGWETLFGLGQRFLLMQSSLGETLKAPIEDLITAMGHRGELVLFGVLALVMVAVLDRIVEGVRQGRATLLM